MPHTFALLFAVLLPAAPVPKGAKPVYYAATKVGDRREYRRADGREPYAIVVTRVEENPNGGLLVTEARESEGAPPKPFRVLAVTADGVATVEELYSRLRRLDRPHFFVRPLAKPGDKWEWEAKRAEDRPRPANVLSFTLKYTVGVKEMVTVPAGTFDCVRVEMEHSKDGSRDTFWHEPGVGLVKRASNNGLNIEPIVLHAFTAGK